MSKKLIIVTILIAVFAMGAAVVSAQGNGNRGGGAGGNGTRGGGRGTQIQQNLRTPTNPDCIYDTTGVIGSQMNATGNNTAGTGSAGQGNQNGQMNGGSGMYGTAGMNGTGLYANLPPATVSELPEDVANLVLYLASDESGFVNGAEMLIDNASTITPPLGV